jgi:MYXO-CTERM domain-containing protein
MKRIPIIGAIVCMSIFMGTSYDGVAQNDTPATVNTSTDDDDDDNDNWGLLGLLGLVGLLGLKRREATNNVRTTGTRTDR